MLQRSQVRRLAAMAVLMVIAFAGLGYRLVELQVLEHDQLSKESAKDTRAVLVRGPMRGEIRDIRGTTLATSAFVKTVCADPFIIGEHAAEVAHAVAPILKMSEHEFLQKLKSPFRTNEENQVVPNHFVPLKKKVSLDDWEQIKQAMQQLPTDKRQLTAQERKIYKEIRLSGISTGEVDDQLRVYPNQSLAAHVLGYVGTTDIRTPVGIVQQIEGKDGIERALDKPLRGTIGWRHTEVAKHHELVTFRREDVDANPGDNVILTLDAGVQYIVESELATVMAKHTPISASCVVVRPRTGEILALATLPSFDPSELDVPPELRRNRVITDVQEPGSTFKIVVISGALNDGLITLQDRFDCDNGKFWFANHLLHDHEPYGVLSVEEIITHSSNIGAAKVGIQMGPDRLYQYMRDFGFGTRTGIPLWGEVSGIIHPVTNWTKLSISRIPMGQEVAVTPLQMVMAMSAIANGGRLMRPMLVDRLEDADGHVLFRNAPQPVRQVVGERAARDMVTALKTVVSSDGTGKKAALEHYTVAGKTGTAQKIVNHQYSREKHFSSFIGFFPADDPELCVGVFLDEPKHGYYGGEAAAPVFRNIAERAAQYLAIKPDVLPEPPPSPFLANGSKPADSAAEPNNRP